MRPRDAAEGERLTRALDTYEAGPDALPGLATIDRRRCLVEQMVESERRVRYVRYFVNAPISDTRLDPASGRFDPLKAAILQQRHGNLEEACWLVFLFTHFGKHRVAAWDYSATVFAGDGPERRWNWGNVSVNVDAVRDWLEENKGSMSNVARPHGFGNHRKYESLDGWTQNGTGAVVASYVDWVHSLGDHQTHVARAVASGGGDPGLAFQLLYQSMNPIRRFGRTARFDYLCMLGKLDIAPVQPARAYLVGSTGPLAGARLLFGSRDNASQSAEALDARLIGLDRHLEIGFDPLEDSLCNWQKSPDEFRPFRG